MASKFNPNNPSVAGSEWFGSRSLVQPVSQALGRGPTLLATVTETIEQIYGALQAQGPGTPSLMVCDVYDLANPIADPVVPILCRPGANFSNADHWFIWESGIPIQYDATAYTDIDEVVGTDEAISGGASTQVAYGGINPSLVAQVLFTGDNSVFYHGDSGASGATIAGKRICRVDVVCIVENDSGHSVRLDGYLNIGGVRYASQSGPKIVGPDGPLTRLAFTWNYHPHTAVPWNQADAAALTNGTDAFGIGVVTKSGGDYFRVTTVGLRLWVTTERRLATGFAFGPAVGQEKLAPFPLASVVDHASVLWNKTSGHRYLILYSDADGTLPTAIFGVDSALVAHHETDQLAGSTAAAVSLAYGAVPSAAALNETTAAAHAVLQHAGVASVDSNPYAATFELRVGADDPWPIVQQTLSSESGQTYGSARVLVGTDRSASGTVQTAPLVFRLRKASDNSVLAGPIDISPADVPADGKYHTVDVHFSPVALTAGQGVILELTSAQPGAGTGWRVPLLYCMPLSVAFSDPVALEAAAVGIGGGADRGEGTTAVDFPWSIAIAPPNPGGLAAEQRTIANRPVLAHTPASGDSPTLIGYAHLSWTATTIGAGFAYNEIQRLVGGTWQTIARITAEASNYYNDREGPRGTVAAPVARSYRIRTVRLEGGFSDWVAFPAVHVEVEACGDVVVSSNQSTLAPLAFRDLGGNRSWEQQQTARAKEVPILGLPDPMMFFPQAGTGENFLRKLAVAYNDGAVGATVTADHAVFEPALALLQDRTVAYMAYADAWGKVWLTSPLVQSPGPTRDEPGGQYSIPVLFKQVARAAAPDVTAVPWAP